MGIIDTIASAYQSTLGRTADKAGLDYWTSQVNQGNIKISDINIALANAAPADAANKKISDVLAIQTQQQAEAAAAQQAQYNQSLDLISSQNAQYQQSLEQMNTQYADLQKQLAEANAPKDINATTKGSGMVTGGGKSLAESDLDKRRGTVSKAYLGARKLQIPLANKGVSKGSTSINTSTNAGLQV